MLPVRRSRPRRRHARRRRRPLDWRRVATGWRRPARTRPGHRRWGPLVAASLVLVPAATLLVSAPAAGASPHTPADPAPSIGHVPPVDAPIVDPFRPPAGPYGAGNRGLEYDTTPGDPVRASAPGVVVFAGRIAGSLHVTVRHADGVRTSYSFLGTVDTRLGTAVGAGDVIGTAGERLHFGARVGDAYFDPAMLFTGTVGVELLPFEVPPGSTPDGEARALLELAVLDGGPSLGDLTPSWRWLRERAGDGLELLAPGVGPGSAGVLGRSLTLTGDLTDRLLFPPPCSDEPPPLRPAAGGDRVAVTVAGLGSSSESAAVDDLRTGELGYADGRVVRFSYAGGRTPGTGDALRGLDGLRGHDGLDSVDGVATSRYTSADTQGDIGVAARRLADLVEGVAAAEPGATIDVYAHSLGGVVTRMALLDLEQRGFELGRLGVVVTIAAPHEGADVATALATAADAPRAGAALDLAADLLDVGLDPDAPVVHQLSERSTLVDELARAGVPEDVRLLSIGARGDLVVAAPRTHVDGAAEVTVPTAGLHAHSAVVGSDEATAEIARALAGRPPGCEAWHDVVADVVVGHAVSAVEDDLGLVLAAAG